MKTIRLLAAAAVLALLAPHLMAAGRTPHIRLGQRGTIIATKVNRAPVESQQGVAAGAASAPVFPHPRPRLAGYSPFVAVTTSDLRRPSSDDSYEHDMRPFYLGNPINPPANINYVIGVMDTGAIAHIVAGTAAETIGVSGEYLTANTIPIGGVGKTVDAYVTWPLAFFFSGLSGIEQDGLLDLNALRGHSNVSAIASPPIICGEAEVISMLVGTTYIAHTNLYVRVDTPRTIMYNGAEITGPDIAIGITSFPDHTRAISINLAPVPAATSNYYPDIFDFEDQESPAYPTLLSIAPGFPPIGGWFTATIFLLEGEPSPTNPAQSFTFLVDTGAQSSIISSGVAASLSLPFEPDFTVDVCGVGGTQEGVPGYYVDYAKMNAAGGALEFSRAPFIVLDLQKPDGSGPLDGIIGMNFFWNRNITLEPNTSGPGFITVSDPVEFAGGDFDVDMDVDEQDAAGLAFCAGGPAASSLPPDCEHIDVDLDLDIDLRDYAWLQACYSGHGLPADTSCGP